MQADPIDPDEIARSVGEGRPGVPVDESLTRGQRALVRRRFLAGTGATLAVVAIFGTTAVVAGGSAAHTSQVPGYSGRPGASPITPAPALRTPSQREAQRAMKRPLARFDDRGRLVLVPQTQLVRRVDNPFAGSEPGKSVALELNYRHVRYWFALYQAPNRSAGWSSFMWSGDYDGSFASWVGEQFMVEESDPSPGGGQDEWPGIPDLELVRFVGSTQRLEPVAGVTILRLQAHVSVGKSFADSNDQTAAAKVEAADGERYYVLARRVTGGAPQYIAVAEADGGPTLGNFLELARTRYANSGGGLL